MDTHTKRQKKNNRENTRRKWNTVLRLREWRTRASMIHGNHTAGTGTNVAHVWKGREIELIDWLELTGKTANNINISEAKMVNACMLEERRSIVSFLAHILVARPPARSFWDIVDGRNQTGTWAKENDREAEREREFISTMAGSYDFTSTSLTLKSHHIRTTSSSFALFHILSRSANTDTEIGNRY